MSNTPYTFYVTSFINTIYLFNFKMNDINKQQVFSAAMHSSDHKIKKNIYL